MKSNKGCPHTIGKWRKRFIADRIEGLYDEMRTGRPRTVEDEAVAELITKTLARKPKAATHWSVRAIAKETGTVLEINSSSRLDLRDLYIRRAKAEGVKMIINTDSHQKEQMNGMEYGVLQARRGWAEKSDIINTGSVEELLKSLKK